MEDSSRNNQTSGPTPGETPTAPSGPPRYKLGEWLGGSWNLFKARIVDMVALALTATAAYIILMAVLTAVSTALQLFLMRQGYLPQDPPGVKLVPSGTIVLLSLAAAVAVAAVYAPLNVGFAAVTLRYVRTGEFDWRRIWTGYRKWRSSFLLGLWPGLLQNVPWLFLPLLILVPIWLAVSLWIEFGAFALSEEGVGYRLAIKHGFRLVMISFWPAVLFAFVAEALSVSGVIACCVGLPFTLALYQVLVAVAYNNLTQALPLDTDSA